MSADRRSPRVVGQFKVPSAVTSTGRVTDVVTEMEEADAADAAEEGEETA